MCRSTYDDAEALTCPSNTPKQPARSPVSPSPSAALSWYVVVGLRPTIAGCWPYRERARAASTLCSARNLSSCFRGAIWAVGVGARRGQSSERRGHRSGARGSWRTVGKSGGTRVVISCASREWGSPEPRRSTLRARPRPRSQSHGVRAAWRTADSDPRNPNPADEAKRSRVCPVKRTSASSPPPARDRQSLTTLTKFLTGLLCNPDPKPL